MFAIVVMGKDPHDFEEVLSVRTQAMRHTNIIQAALAAMTHMTLMAACSMSHVQGYKKAKGYTMDTEMSADDWKKILGR
jgi:hypothetical protein